MSFTTYTGSTNKIASLGTTPEERGLTTEQFKAKFDEFAAEFVAWFNTTHVVEGNAHLAETATDSVLGHIKIGTGLSIDAGGIVTPAIVPSARVYHSADQSIANTVNTKLAFNNERFDTDGIHDNTTNNTRLTCKTAGKYMIIANAAWDRNATGIRRLMIFLNNSTVIGYTTSMGFDDGSTLQTQVVDALYNLAVNDYVELLVYQESGGALNIKAVGNYSPEFMMVKVG